ncbi:hypothetical protein KRP22_010160 [Phytophthora ramorum]|nr:Prosaposin [Phytophthora ramorum]
MRPVYALLPSLAAAAAVASADHGGRPGLGHRQDAEMPCHHDQEEEETAGLMAVLNEHFQRSSEMLQQFFSLGEPQEADVIVIIEAEEEDPRKTACLKALEKIHEQDELQQQTETLAKYFRSALDVVSLQLWGAASCDDLERSELVEECNRVLSSEEVVKEFLQEGKTDDEVCDIMATVEDLEGADNLSCKLCQRFVQMVDQALSQEVQQVQQVRVIIGDLCDAMSTDSMCHTFLKNFDAIVVWLKHGTDPLVVCTRIAMCSPDSGSDSQISDVPAYPEELETIGDGALTTPEFLEKDQSCFFCSRVAGVIYQVNSLFPEQLPMLKSVLGSVCQLASEDAKCQEVEANFDYIVELVQQDQHPREICQAADFCPKQNMHDMPPSDRVHGDDKTCVYCDAATTVVEVIMQEQPDQIDQIREYADMICGMLGDDSPCHEYVNQLDTVVDSLKKGVHPREICKALKYCSAERMDGPPLLDESPRVGMMRNGRHGHHAHVGMEGPGGRHGHHGHGKRDKMGVIPHDEHPPHPPHPRPHPHGSCFFCSRVAMVIHHVNHTSPEKLPIVKTILTNVCQLVPSTCKCDVVDKNFDKIVELEKQGKHPHEICKSLGVCNKTRGWEEGAPSIADEMKGVVVASQWPPGNATECTYCQFATTVAKIALQQYGTDISQIRAYADMICDMLGADNPCHVYVKEFDFVIDSITKGMSSKAICTELKFCTAAMDKQPALADSEGNAVVLSSEEHPPHNHGCSFCIHVGIAIHHVNQTDPGKLPIVKTILTNVCKLAKPDCKCDEVDKNFDKIVELEKEGKRPHEICKTIGLCKKQVDVVADEYSFADTVSALIVASRPDAVEGDTKTCFFCDYATTLVQAVYEQDATKIGQIKQLADTACALMGEECGCHKYIAKLDFVLDSLKNGTHPHAICVSMNYCPANNTLPSPASSPSSLSAYDPVLVQMMKESMEVSVDGCFFCTQVASIIEVAVAQDPSKIAQIRQIADVVCGMLPSDNQCHSFVKQFDAAVDSLQKGEQPKAICHDLKYCTVDTNPAMAKLAMPSVDMIAVRDNDEESNTCAYCSGIVTVLKYALDQKPEQVKEMREAAGIVCELLPADDTCHDDLKMFDEAVTDLQAGKEPQEICQTLKFCTATQGTSSLVSGLLDFKGSDFLPSRCASCQQNTLLLASLITRPNSLATFEREINSVCRLIPDSSECELLMKHQDMIVDSLKNNEDVETICTRIAACGPAAAEEVPAEKSMSVGCLFCEYTADLLERAKDNEKALREAKMTLETICTVLPPRARCDVLSSKFDELVSLMRKGKSPSQACNAIALCDADFVYTSTPGSKGNNEDPIVQAFEKGRQSMGNVMEIQ